MASTILLNDQIRDLLAQFTTQDGQTLITWMTSLKVEDGNVMIIFEAPTDKAKEVETLRQKAEEAIQKLSSVNQVRSILTSQRPFASQNERT